MRDTNELGQAGVGVLLLGPDKQKVCWAEPPIGVAMAAHVEHEGFMKCGRLDPVREQLLGVFDNGNRLLTAPPAGGEGGQGFGRNRGFAAYRFP